MSLVVSWLAALSLACNTACHYEGYESGRATKVKCICEDSFDQDLLLNLKKRGVSRKSEPALPQKDDRPWAKFDYED